MSLVNKKENEEPEGEVIDTSQPEYEFNPGLKGHDWRQQGPFLICQSCELKHSVYIGMDKQLMGIDEEGMPIIKKR